MSRMEEIRDRIRKGTAVVLSAAELKQRISRGETPGDVDVVTCGTCGVMSGTYAVLSVPVTPPGMFLRAETVSLNGVPAIPGPCPNERLGLVDMIVYGTAHGSDTYGGGHLFQDIIANRTIHVDITAGGKEFQAEISGHNLPHARLFTTRSAFKNYTAIINQSDNQVHTIFSVLPLGGKSQHVTVSGCGEINPVENDPSLRFLQPGMPVLLNGGPGYVIGEGTRSSRVRPNIAVHGEMNRMDPHFCGGFKTSAGPECLTSIAMAIPVIDKSSLQNLLILDGDIQLPVMDITDRQQVASATYDRVWSGTARTIRFDHTQCLHCDDCIVRRACPVDAIQPSGEIDNIRCFRCGTCVHFCVNQAYRGNFGTISLPYGDIPIVLRQSDRDRAEKLCNFLKTQILEGIFPV
jgi:putative methanogenesis marker 16 metalloprotein